MQYQQAKKFILDKLKQEFPKHLSYHNITHTKNVFNSCKLIAKQEGVRGENLKLLLTAALFHDSGFIVQQKDHEQISCGFAQRYLPAYGYSEKQISCICGMIMATRIPQTPLNKLEEILADADLDYLGWDDYFTMSKMLFEELSFHGILNSEKEWNKIQIHFLEKHRYFTQTANMLRNEKKAAHIRALKADLKS